MNTLAASPTVCKFIFCKALQTGLAIVNEAGDSFKYVEHLVRELILFLEKYAND